MRRSKMLRVIGIALSLAILAAPATAARGDCVTPPCCPDMDCGKMLTASCCAPATAAAVQGASVAAFPALWMHRDGSRCDRWIATTRAERRLPVSLDIGTIVLRL